MQEHRPDGRTPSHGRHDRRDVPNRKLIAKFAHELRHEQRFETEADVKEALKERCAQRGAPYDADSIRYGLDVSDHAREQPRRRTRP